MPVRPRTKKKFAVTLIMSVAAFVLLSGQFCPFGAKEQAPAPAPAPAPVAVAPEAPEPVAETPDAEPQEAPPAGPADLEVKSLSLVDGNGNARATLNTDDSGAPAFTLMDAEGATRSRISLDGNGNPFIDLYNSKGEILSSYWIENDEPFLTYRDKDGKTVTIIPKEAAAPPRPVVNRPVVKVPTTTTKAPANSNFVVYYNSKSNRYHLRSCNQLSKGSNAFSTTVAEAVAKNLVPCQKCRPPVLGVPGSVRSTVPTTGENRSNLATPAGANNPTVYYNSKSKKYHVLSCPELKEGKNKFPIGMNEAKAQGFWPCPKCRPPQ